MKRRPVVRIELVLLAFVVLLLAGRLLVGPPEPDGLVVLTDLDRQELVHETLVLEEPTTLVFDAVGAWEGAADEAQQLAAYAWALRQADGAPVWQMTPANAERLKSALARTSEVVRLDAGTYDVYFTTFGNDFGGDASFLDRVFGSEARWQSSADEWRLVVRAPGSGEAAGGRARPVGLAPAADAPPVFWTSAPQQGRATKAQLFEVVRPTAIHVHAVGEIGHERFDWGWIEDAVTGDRVWEMTRQNTQPAGGADENRMFEGQVRLDAGVYRATFQTDAGHDARRWRANPPLHPDRWGLTLRASDVDAVRAFDPWQSGRPLVQITQVPDRHHRQVQFRISEPTRVMAYALGEITRDVYDYGWLVNDDTGERVWTMTESRSQHAGGARKNRQETAFLALEPGTYTLHYKTDDSHAYGDWNQSSPDHPERWGVTLFGLDPGAEAEVLRQVGQDGRAPNVEAPPAPPAIADVPLPPLGAGEGLVDQRRVGNDARVERPFELKDPARLRILALGELKEGKQYDWGWIEDARTGAAVWEMTWANTQPAGGDAKNRRFDDVIELAPGRYVLHYRTDFSHAFDDFSDAARPSRPDDWGIVVERVE